jgi:hypothetical protein
MASETLDTLSQYLRDKANVYFPVYPEQEDRSRLPLETRREVREWVNEALEKTLE